MFESLLALLIILVLSFIGIPLAYSTLVVGMIGFAAYRGLDSTLVMANQQILEAATSYGLSVIPAFILMGTFIHKADISRDLYEVGHAWVGRLKGGLAISTIIACAAFSAVCGSSLATAASMTKVAMPQMRKFRYADSLSSGTLAAGGTLGILIPPSVILAIYGIVAEEDIGKLFIAGILPGILLVGLFSLAIFILVQFYPHLGPKGDVIPRREKIKLLLKTGPIIVLFIVVLGGIYLGVFTPTEAGAIGSFGAYLFAFSKGKMRKISELLTVFLETTKTTAMIFTIVFAAHILSNFLNIAGLPGELLNIVYSFDVAPIYLVLIICVICVLLGTIFESIGILLLVIPVFIPSLLALEVDLIWFGILVIIVIEMGLITPPIGMNVFTVKSVVKDVPLNTIFVGVLPFIVATFIALMIILFFPPIATFLPELMR